MTLNADQIAQRYMTGVTAGAQKVLTAIEAALEDFLDGRPTYQPITVTADGSTHRLHVHIYLDKLGIRTNGVDYQALVRTCQHEGWTVSLITPRDDWGGDSYLQLLKDLPALT